MSNNITLRPAVADLLKKLDAGKPRVAFVLHATQSRESTWDLAAKLQADMFTTAIATGLELQVTYFRGLSELSASPWMANPVTVRNLMERVTCRSGHTQIGRSLRHVKAEHARKPIAAVILIGDCCEETPADVYLEAQMLGVPVFAFLEGDNQSAARVFQRIAELTHGAFCPFGAGSVQQLGELLKAVAVYASGGLVGLEHQDTRSAKLLLTQLRGKS